MGTLLPMENSATELNPAVPRGAPPLPDMVWVPGGTFTMGSDRHYPEERPAHRVTVDGFWMDRTPVTNERFTRFVEATGHVTFAEIPPNPEDYPGALPHMLYAGSLVFVKPDKPVDRRDIRQWWHFMRGADWRHPQGPESSIEGWISTRWCTFRSATPRHLRSGRARLCRRKRNGNSPAAAGWRAPHTPGARSFFPGTVTWPTPGRESFPGNKVRGRLRRHVAGGELCAKWIRPLGHDRQRVGMDDGLVRSEASERSAESLLCAPESQRAVRD